MFGINLRLPDGTAVFTSVNTPSATSEVDPWWAKPFPVGMFESRCYIPSGLLNDKHYVAIITVTDYEPILTNDPSQLPIIHLDNLLEFRIIDPSGYMSVEYQRGWHGVMRPKLNWQTQHIESN